MSNYKRKPFKVTKHRHHFNKWHAKKITIDNHKFDSKVEGGWYLHLKAKGVIFKIHVSFIIKPFHVTKNGIHIRSRKYTPDFVIYKTIEDLKNNRPCEVDDVKGFGKIQPQDSMKFGAFEDKYDIPVYIIRWDRKQKAWTRKTRCF